MNEHYVRGQHLLQQGRFEHAAEELRKSIGLSPEWTPAHCSLALALLRLGCGQEALKTVEGALAQSPNDEYAHWMMALVQLERNDLKAAESAARQAIELAPEDPQNRALLIKQAPGVIQLRWAPAAAMLFTAMASDLREWLEKRRPDVVIRHFE